jgi:flagellar biosynthesis/type III secretory pathway protein FliH
VIRRLQADTIFEAVDRRQVTGGRELPASVDLAESHDAVDAIAYRAGYAEGFEAGESDGLREAAQRMQELEDEARRRLQELVTERERLVSLMEAMAEALSRHGSAMEELAFEVALISLSRAFGQLSDDRQLLQRLCTQVVEESHVKAVRVCVSVEDHSALPEQIKGLEVIAESGLARGECRIETGRGQVESSIAMRLSAICDTMLETLGTDRS